MPHFVSFEKCYIIIYPILYLIKIYLMYYSSKLKAFVCLTKLKCPISDTFSGYIHDETHP